MNQLFSLVILCQFAIFFTVIVSDIVPDPPNEVKLQVVYANEPEFTVPLKKTDSMLANENLPVWSVRGDNPGKLQLEKEVMERLGRFSMYQDKETTSAAVYLHRDEEFHGTIDIRFVINSLPLSSMKKQIKVDEPRYRGVLARSSCLYRHARSTSPEPVFSNRTESSRRIQREASNIVYIELLLVVYYDVLGTLEGRSLPDLFDQVVSHSLTLINSADMLFSKVDEPKIKLNIAGIVIGTDHESFPLLARCQRKEFHREETAVYDYILVECALPSLASYLRTQSAVIPPDSYDIAILITSQILRNRKLLSFWQQPRRVWGVASAGGSGPYKLKKNNRKFLPTIAVETKEDYGSFATVAHEIGHILGHPGHDEKSNVDENEDCCRRIMKPSGSFCQKCLSWSPESESRFRKFFSSRDGCFFLNEPRSLRKPHPYEVWTAHQQCQCYGFKSASSPRRPLLGRIFTALKTDECENNLRCYDARGIVNKAPIPMDGTPCNEQTDSTKKVCWNKKCIPVPIF